jgi:hypothetical protein
LQCLKHGRLYNTAKIKSVPDHDRPQLQMY